MCPAMGCQAVQSVFPTFRNLVTPQRYKLGKMMDGWIDTKLPKITEHY